MKTKNSTPRKSTMLLRVAVLFISILVLALCVFALPVGIRNGDAGGYRLIFLGMYVPAVPFFIAVYHILKLLNYIDQGKAFSELSVSALRYVKYCTGIISALYAVGLPYIFIVAEGDDAPGVVLLGLIFTGAPLLIAALAAVLQKELKKAIDIKAENDLIV